MSQINVVEYTLALSKYIVEYTLALSKYIVTTKGGRPSLPRDNLPTTDDDHLQLAQELQEKWGNGEDNYQPWKEDALFYASDVCHPQTIKYLLEVGVDPTCHNSNPLLFACERGDVEVVGYLLQYVDPEEVSDYVVYCTILHDNLSVFRLLVPANYQWPDRFVKKNILEWIICDGKLQLLEYMMATFPFTTQHDYNSNILTATENGKLEILRFLHRHHTYIGDSSVLFSEAVRTRHWSVLFYLMQVYQVGDIQPVVSQKHQKPYYYTGTVIRRLPLDEFVTLLVNFLKGKLQPIEFPGLAQEYLFDGNVGMILAQYVQ